MKKHLLYSFLGIVMLVLAASCKRDTGTNEHNGNNGGISNRAAANAPEDAVVTTVANIIERPNGVMEYTFNEREAGYFVARTDPAYGSILKLAREALAGRKPVKLYATSPGAITRLDWPSAPETTAYLEWYRSNILNAEPNRKLDINFVDTSVFNLADWQNWNVFRLCRTTVPDITTAKKIFDYCRQQTCTFGPTQEQPCIPFSYVRDGCFARAHKMRRIIEEKFKYCTEKVFSFGYGSTLWVQANLWGGCCVNWWYHVAPVLRVKNSIGKTVCYVIDPGMFTAPVTLSTWLDAQDNTYCNANASLSSYSIQPSTAYTPVWGNPVTQYTTDPNYTLTNQDLINYAQAGTTCGN